MSPRPGAAGFALRTVIGGVACFCFCMHPDLAFSGEERVGDGSGRDETDRASETLALWPEAVTESEIDESARAESRWRRLMKINVRQDAASMITP